ncbi:MAG: hypothetical protein J3R72DRAFT_505581 [Linnemannia gamsii]|nr:MAG: hypothetical protein J3R72DRAFT_505581 [Linnemannia gamsii]
MDGVFPLCFTANEAYFYAVAIHIRQGAGSRNRLVLTRSPSSSFNDLIWDVLGGTFNYPFFAKQWAEYTYNCAWNPETSVMVLTGEISDENYHPGSNSTLNRFGIEVPAMITSRWITPRYFIHFDLSGPLNDSWPSFRRNRGVLMPDMDRHDSLLSNSSRGWISEEYDMPTWVFAQLSAHESHLTLAEFYNEWFPETYNTLWNLNTYGSSSLGPIKYEILAHSNDKFFVLGSAGSKGHLVGLVIPFSLSIPTPSQPNPTLNSIRVVESTLGQDCDLGHEWTTSAAHGNQIFLLCHPKAQNGSKVVEAFQLYSFNGTTFRHVSSIATAVLTPAANHTIAPLLTIAPDSSSIGTSATWAYVSLDNGTRSYSLDLTMNATATTTNTIQTDLGASKPFIIDHDYEFNDWPSPTWTSSPSSDDSYNISIWMSWIAAIIFICVLIVKLVRRYQLRTQRKLALAQGALPICPNPLLLPTHHRPRGSRVTAPGSEGGVAGVTRTQYGEDASDALPMYTLRAPPGSTADSLTVVVSDVEAPSESPPTPPPFHAPEPMDPPPFHTPEPMDLPPCYTAIPSSPVQSHETNTPIVATSSPSSAEGLAQSTTTTTTNNP